jgi:hypothetical protein
MPEIRYRRKAICQRKMRWERYCTPDAKDVARLALDFKLLLPGLGLSLSRVVRDSESGMLASVVERAIPLAARC